MNFVVGEVSSVNPNIFSFISKQWCQIFILYLFWICIRNFWSISTRRCNWEPTQTLKWFITCILGDLYSTECPADTISRCSWLNIGKFFKYPFLFVCIHLCTFFFCFLGRVPIFLLFKLYVEQQLIFLNHSNRFSLWWVITEIKIRWSLLSWLFQRYGFEDYILHSVHKALFPGMTFMC